MVSSSFVVEMSFGVKKVTTSVSDVITFSSVPSSFVESCVSASAVAVADVIDDNNSGVSLTLVSVVVSSSFVESCSSAAAVAVADVIDDDNSGVSLTLVSVVVSLPFSLPKTRNEYKSI